MPTSSIVHMSSCVCVCACVPMSAFLRRQMPTSCTLTHLRHACVSVRACVRAIMQLAEVAARLQEVLEGKEEAVSALNADVLRLTKQREELSLALDEARARAEGRVAIDESARGGQLPS